MQVWRQTEDGQDSRMWERRIATGRGRSRKKGLRWALPIWYIRIYSAGNAHTWHCAQCSCPVFKNRIYCSTTQKLTNSSIIYD